MTNMDSYLRNPTARVFVSWKDVLASGEWARLDQSLLDDGALLTSKSYLENEQIIETITDIDARLYDDESEFVATLEGYSELVGDSLHYATSDLDFKLLNTNNRFTPRSNKNLLINSNFEKSKSSWNEVMGAGANGIINTNDVLSPIRSYQLNNPSSNNSYIFSNRIVLDDYTDKTYVYSQYITGSGIANIQLRSYSLVASGASDITTGLVSTGNNSITLVSGQWNRFSQQLFVPSGIPYLRAIIASDSGWLRVDNGQVEEGLVSTNYNNNFIGDLILPKKSVKVDVGFSDNNVRKFAGSIKKIKPNIKDDSVEIYCYDWVNVLKDKQIFQTYYQNLRTDQLIAALAGTGGIDYSKMKLDIGKLTVEFAWFQDASAWTYINQIAEAEGGIVFFDEEGVLNFYNRTHFDTYPNPVYGFTFDSNIIDLSFDIDKNSVKNRIEVKANPKKLLVNKLIYSIPEAQSISAGETYEMWGRYNYSVGVNVPALNVSIPVIGSGIMANSLANGTGTNQNSNIIVTSSSVFQESIKVNIKNNSASPIYITKFDVYGDPIVIKSRIEIVREDVNSKLLYDTQLLAIENDLMDDNDYAITLAEKKLSEMKNPLDNISIDCVGAPFLRVGDIVSVQRSFDGKTENFQILKNRWQLDGEFTQKLGLQKKVGISKLIYN